MVGGGPSASVMAYGELAAQALERLDSCEEQARRVQAGSSCTLSRAGIERSCTSPYYQQLGPRSRTRRVSNVFAHRASLVSDCDHSQLLKQGQLETREKVQLAFSLEYSNNGEGNTVTMASRVQLTLFRDDPDASEIPHAKFPLALTAVRRCPHHHPSSLDPELMA